MQRSSMHAKLGRTMQVRLHPVRDALSVPLACTNRNHAQIAVQILILLLRMQHHPHSVWLVQMECTQSKEHHNVLDALPIHQYATSNLGLAIHKLM